MLDALGLSARHEAIYRTMLQSPHLNVAGLAEHLEITAADVREALDVLAELALIRLDPSGALAHVVRPQAGLLVLLAKVEAEVAVRQQQIEATRAAIAAIANTAPDATVEVRRLEGLDAVRERLVELAYNARIECLSFTTGSAQSPDTIQAEKPLNQAALARGVQIRNVYQDSLRNDPTTLAHARWMAGLGGQTRTTPIVPMRMVIVDREITLVPLDPIDSRLGALELHSPGVIAGLVAFFEHVWVTGTPFGDQAPVDEHGLTPQERELLQMLAVGYTDDSAARKLGVSLRSVQRMMTKLTERLGATSRFQAGVEAGRCGWT